MRPTQILFLFGRHGKVTVPGHPREVRVVLGPPEACPHCGYRDVRETRRPLQAWEWVFRLRRFRCQGCWRRVVVFRGLFGERRDGGIYNRG